MRAHAVRGFTRIEKGALLVLIAARRAGLPALGLAQVAAELAAREPDNPPPYGAVRTAVGSLVRLELIERQPAEPAAVLRLRISALAIDELVPAGGQDDRLAHLLRRACLKCRRAFAARGRFERVCGRCKRGGGYACEAA